jgi:hypothetical protein
MNFDRMRRSLLALALLAAGSVSAQTWPTGPIKLIVPFPAGGSVDMVARAVGKRLSETLGQPVVVDNRAGASGNIGAEAAARCAGRRQHLLHHQLRRAGGQPVPLQAHRLRHAEGLRAGDPPRDPAAHPAGASLGAGEGRCRN